MDTRITPFTIAISDRDLDDRVFVISHMVVELLQTPAGPLLAFNGTTEWALDSIEVDEVVWLPLEHQLRELLGALGEGARHLLLGDLLLELLLLQLLIRRTFLRIPLRVH